MPTIELVPAGGIEPPATRLSVERSTAELRRTYGWLQWVDLNHRPSGYEPDELTAAPHCNKLVPLERFELPTHWV